MKEKSKIYLFSAQGVAKISYLLLFRESSKFSLRKVKSKADRSLKEVFVFVSSQSVRLLVSLSPNVIYNISMTVLDFGFHSMDSGFQVLDSLFFVIGTWILHSNH